MTMDDSIKRWTAKRKTALVIELIQGRTTVAEASRSFDLTPSEIEGWQVRKRAIGIRPRIQAVPSVATAPNERWSTDLARVWTGKDGWASLALVIDCHTRELLGWHLSRSGKATTASAALEHALIARFGTLGRVDREFLLRSDNGLVFTSRHFTALVRSYHRSQEVITPHCPQHVRRRHTEPCPAGAAPCCPARRPACNPLNKHAFHQPRHRVSRDIEALAAKLPPDLPDALDPPVLFEDPKDLGAQSLVPACTIRQPRRIGPPRQMFIRGGRGDRQHAANRPSPSGLNRWRLDGSPPCASRCASMNPTITSTGARASPARLKPCRIAFDHRKIRWPCEGYRSPGAARGFAVQRLQLLGHLARNARPPAAVHLGRLRQVVQGLGRATDLRGDRHPCLPAPPMLTLIVDQAHRAFTHFRGKLFIVLRMMLHPTQEVKPPEKPESFRSGARRPLHGWRAAPVCGQAKGACERFGFVSCPVQAGRSECCAQRVCACDGRHGEAGVLFYRSSKG